MSNGSTNSSNAKQQQHPTGTATAPFSIAAQVVSRRVEASSGQPPSSELRSLMLLMACQKRFVLL